MTLQGYQFDKAKVTPESDAKLYSYLAQSSDNKVISGMTATTTGLNVYVASGKALVQGRLVEVTQQHQLTAQANKTGYVCITIDLTQNNTSTGTPGTSGYSPVNNQLRLELVDVLNQQGLNSGGLIYTFPIYSYVSTGATITLTKIDKSFFKKIETTTIDLGWGMSVTLAKKEGFVFANGTTTPASSAGTSGGTNVGVRVPDGFRPLSGQEVTIKLQGNNGQWGSYVVTSDGNIRLITGGMNVGYTFHVNGAWVAE